MMSLIAIAIGASLGAWIRWGLSLLLNQGNFPHGTLMANLIGAYLMGVSLALLIHFPQLNQETKLLITTGFLGGLTTFSTFSAEAFGYLQKQDYSWLLTHVAANVVGSILLTFLGYITVQAIKH